MANTKIIAPHDDIIAHTDFYTWQAVLSDAFHTQSRSEASRALWPRLTYRVLKGLDRSKDEGTARIDFLNELNEIRNYRNRLSNNDCIWIKIHSKNLQSAVEIKRGKNKQNRRTDKNDKPTGTSIINEVGFLLSRQKNMFSKRGRIASRQRNNQ